MSLSSDYTLIDKTLHNIAFFHPMVQKVLCDIENDIYKNKFEKNKLDRPVFVAGLPRAGTTLLLDLLYRTDEFVTYTYRHMPFILSPLLWSKISQPFRKKAEYKERAHGDGMMVSFDNPEAFEEIIWLAYMRDKIELQDRLSPMLADDVTTEFSINIKRSIKKLIYLSNNNESNQAGLRYLSKNNANISRIEALATLFPDAILVVPFRHPLTHVGSLMKQHERFSARHSDDRFSRNYMRWLGHYEFGDNFKPINFDGWLDGMEALEKIDMGFWLEYWCAAYRYVLNNERNNEQLVLIDYDQLLASGKPMLQRIAERVELNNKSRFMQGGEILRQPTTRLLDQDGDSSEICHPAQELHAKLQQHAI